MKSDTNKPPTPPGQSGRSRLGRARHDLRNPLSEILGFSEILQEEAAERGLEQMVPGFAAIHQSAARIFAEVNHWLNPDTIQLTPESFHELERTVQSLSQRIISTAENLSEKCDELENNWVGDDLLRIEGAARKLQDLAPPLLQQLADAFARSKRPPHADSAALASGEALTETTFVREPESDAGAASG